tara:strand:- start:15927 stop:16658 length:732 start_codon:yes stop_codon:yes gene_type:complete
MLPSDPSPITALILAVIGSAQQRSLQVTRDPEQLTQTRTKSASIQDTFNDATDATSQLRPEMANVSAPVGIFIKSHSSYAIQIGMLGGELITGEWEEDYYSELISQWHGYQQYAAIARTYLLSDYSDDLNLFLVGPAGSNDEREWQNFSQVIERNDLVCRKLVWLPSKNDHEWMTELSAFLERTFLAEPWTGSATTSGINLDALSDSMAYFDAWREVLERPEFRTEPLDHTALVKALLEETSE